MYIIYKPDFLNAKIESLEITDFNISFRERTIEVYTSMGDVLKFTRWDFDPRGVTNADFLDDDHLEARFYFDLCVDFISSCKPYIDLTTFSIIR